jgi:hypothetical protein
MAEAVQFRAEEARLITRTSAARVGMSDYTVKRDWRRDLDQDIRREGYDYFWPNTSGDFAANPGNQPFPNAGDPDPTGEAITLVHLARRPNGKHAVIVGSKTKLWRFFAMEEGAYFAGTGADSYFEEAPAANAPYYADNASEWQLIGSGFSEDGHRWEALNINGYVWLNNGVDLPMTFRIEESEVVPCYELREQGIACVGTIGETNGVPMCGDISEIQAEYLDELMRPVGDISSDDMTASQSTNTVTTPADFFTSAHVGRTIVWDDETTTKITAFTDARTVTVNTSATVTNSKFTLRNKAVQAGAEFSGLVSANVASGGTSVTASSSFFDVGMVGKTIRFPNGFSAEITNFNSDTNVDIDADPDDAIVDAPFWITDAASLNLVADSDAFTSDMVGQYVIFDSGEVRQITAFVDAKNVTVDLDVAVDANYFQIENQDSYAAFTDQSKIDRVHYRLIWGVPDEPRKFGVVIEGAIEEGSQELTLRFPSKSFEEGQEVVILGAGTSDGNLTATIVSVSMLGRKLLLDTAAETTVEEGDVEHSESVGSIVGFEDLQDDSSGILRILKIGKDTVAIYKDTCIFVGYYTGLSDEPFRFDQIEMPESLTLHYRWSLIDVGGRFHIYAGANSFYKFELGASIPQILPELDLISDKFFSQVSISDDDDVFACDNGVTNEIFIWFPSDSDDKGIVYDYKQNSASTTGISMTAGATVKKPVIGASYGVTEDLFVMGNSEGTVLVYGKADEAQSSWDDEEEIFYRRSAYPFSETKNGYVSDLKSGFGDFGNPHHAKDITAYVLYLASQSPNTSITLTLYQTTNPSKAPTQACNHVITSPETVNLVPMFFRDMFFQWRLQISGKDNPCRIASHSFDVEGVMSASHERRP